MTRSNNESSQGFQGLKELQGNFPTKSNSTPSKQHKNRLIKRVIMKILSTNHSL